MNIQLIGKQNVTSLKLQAEKIVYVRIIERNDNNTIIEINGQKIKARLEADTPDSFLALVENISFEKDRNTIILRIMNSTNNKQIIEEINKQNIYQIIKDFFIENNLPLRDDLMQIAIKMYFEGIKLSKEWIKFFHLTLMKYGESVTNIIFQFLKYNIVIDSDFPDFFYHYKRILKRLLNNVFNSKGTKDNDVYGGDAISILKNLFNLYFGLENSYNISFLDFEKETIIIQSRKERKKNGERYYFDCLSEELGNILVIVDIENNYYNAKLYVEDFLYRKIETNFKGGVEKKSREISKMIQNKRVFISLCRLANPFAFWEKHEQGENIERSIMCNIDISV